METQPPAAAERLDASQVLRAGRAQLFDKRLKAAPRLSYAINHHRNIRGEKMSFGDKPYLIALFCDNHPEIATQACVQVGKSEWLFVSAFYYSEQGLQVMYVLPDDVLRNSVVANRVDRVIAKVPYYRSQLRNDTHRGTDNRGLKHFGHGSIFFAGSNSTGTFIEKPLDVILADELDKFDMTNYAKADDRMSASPYKIKFEVGNPSVDSHGIAARYRESDMRAWMVPCTRCGKRQALDWFENVVEQTGGKNADYRLLDQDWHERCGRDIQFFCRYCRKPMDRLATGEWVAEHPGRRVHGYHLTKLMAAHVKLADLYYKFNAGLGDDTKLQVFFNSDLGLPYAGAGSKITDDILARCRADYLMPAEAGACVMGIDVGKRLHVIVRQIMPGEILRAVFIGTVPDFADLDILMERYNVMSAAVDSMPETRSAQEFVKRFPYKAWMVRYQHRLTEMGKDEKEKILTIDRTVAMDRVLAFYRRGAFLNPRNAPSLDKGDFYRLLKAPTRIYDAEDNHFNWLGSPDHYFHAEVYALLAYIARGEFRVWGVNLSEGPNPQSKRPEDEDDLLRRFPPGTDPGLVEHYRRMFQQMNGEPMPDRMVGNLKGPF